MTPVATAPAALRLEAVTLTLHGAPLLGPLSATVAPGEVWVLMGPSGCGKSSLLAALAGVLAPPLQAQGGLWWGDCALHGLPVQQRRLGLMFQDDGLFAHMTVLENLLFAMPAAPEVPGGFTAFMGRWGAAARAARVQREQEALQALGTVGLADRAQHHPHQLSGGQRQRVALLRTLLARPRALLLDEPFSRLDRPLRAAMRALVWARIAEHHLPTVLVTHDPDDVPPGAAVYHVHVQTTPDDLPTRGIPHASDPPERPPHV